MRTKITIRQVDDGLDCDSDCDLMIKGDAGMGDTQPRCVFSERHSDSDGCGMWWVDAPGKDCPGVGNLIKEDEHG